VSFITEVTLVNKTVPDSSDTEGPLLRVLVADNIITNVKFGGKAPAIRKFFCRVLVQRHLRAENADKSKR